MPKDPERLDRHSATGVSGDLKKGGGGGKFTWGKAGDEGGAPAALDKGDPNYDDDAEKEASKK